MVGPAGFAAVDRPLGPRVAAVGSLAHHSGLAKGEETAGLRIEGSTSDNDVVE